MRIENREGSGAPVAGRSRWRRQMFALMLGALGAAVVPLAAGHSDPRMFAQAATAAAPAPMGMPMMGET